VTVRISILHVVTPLSLIVSAAAMAQTRPPLATPRPERIVISGSKTLQPVVEEWVREFRRARPGLEIVVEGGGTDKGFEELLAGTSQVAMASRQIWDSEREAFAAKNVVFEEFVVARTGIAVLKNKINPVGELDLSALRRIFDGSVTSWREVGGLDEPITVILRNPSSHTADYVRNVIMPPSVLTERGIVVGTQEEVVAEITAKPWAIGFADFDRALSHLDKVEVLRVRTGEGQSRLVFIRSLYFYVRVPVSDTVKALIAFTKSSRGSEIAVMHSYFGPEDPS
jgi:phosphate transport system substrate-binding protein